MWTECPVPSFVQSFVAESKKWPLMFQVDSTTSKVVETHSANLAQESESKSTVRYLYWASKILISYCDFRYEQLSQSTLPQSATKSVSVVSPHEEPTPPLNSLIHGFISLVIGNDLWDQAYLALKAKDQNLVESCEKILSLESEAEGFTDCNFFQ